MLAAPGPVAGLCGGISAGPFAYGSGSGNTLTIPVVRDMTCDAEIHVVMAAAMIGAPGFDTFYSCQSVVDSHGRNYNLGAFGAGVIGSIAASNDPAQPKDRVIIGPTGVRHLSPGDLVAGDSIQIDWNCNFPAFLHTNAMAFAVTGTDGIAEPQYWSYEPPSFASIRYNQGDAYPDFGFDPSTLSWQADYGALVVPQSPAAVLSATAIVPASAVYAPLNGTLIGTQSGGGFALAVALMPRFGSQIDPGGGWNTPGYLLAANYQFLTLA